MPVNLKRYIKLINDEKERVRKVPPRKITIPNGPGDVNEVQHAVRSFHKELWIWVDQLKRFTKLLSLLEDVMRIIPKETDRQANI